MNRVAATSTATSAIDEQSISTHYLVEVMRDLDDGQPTLIRANDPTLGDLQVVTAAQVVAEAPAQHKKIDDGVRLALAFEAHQRRSAEAAANEGREQAFAKVVDTVLAHASKAGDPVAFVDQWAQEFEAHMKAPDASHYAWCQPGACQTHEGDDGLHAEHQGVQATVPAPAGYKTCRGNVLDARLYASDEGGTPVTVASVVGADGNGTILDGPGLDQLIADTGAFLDQLRHMRVHIGEARA